MFCPGCGMRADGDARFCSNCGSPAPATPTSATSRESHLAADGPSVRTPKLTGTHAAVYWAAIVITVGMCLVPPWRYTLDIRGLVDQKPAGYAPLFAPPGPLMRPVTTSVLDKYQGRRSIFDKTEEPDMRYAIRLDFARLALQLAVVWLIGGGLLLTLRPVQLRTASQNAEQTPSQTS
jgi:hypothetical protein